MKTFFLSLILFSLSVAYAQEVVPEVLTFDFLHPSDFKKYGTALYGSKVVVRLQNINKHLYKINESFTQSDFNTSLPGIFSGVELPEYVRLSLPGIPRSAEGVALMPSLPAGSPEIDRHLNRITKSGDLISAAVAYNNSLNNLYQSCDVPYADIEKEVIRITKDFLGSAYTEKRIDQAAGIRKELESAVEMAVKAREYIIQHMPDYMNAIDGQMNVSERIVWEWDKFPLDKKDSRYRSWLIRYRDAKLEIDAYKSQKDSVNSVIKKAYDLVSAMEKFRNENKIQALVNNYRIINEGNFTFQTDTLRVSRDEVTLKISVSPVKELVCEGIEGLIVNETYRTKGGWKVDFSAGLLLNGGSTDFLGNEFQYNAVTDSTVSIQRKNGGGGSLLSVGAFMHIYRRSGTNFNVAISPGLSTTTSFDGLNFHLGGSAIIGRQERLVITLGATAREVKVLDTHYREDVPYLKSDLPNSPPTVKVFPKFGWFLGLTYNWSRLKKG